MMTEQRIGLDSNCLSYLLKTASGKLSEADVLYDECCALIRIWFYVPGRFYITDTVDFECSKISFEDLKELHQCFTSTSYWGVQVNHQELVANRKSSLNFSHKGEKDCQALAEAEDAELSVLLTLDKKFLRHREEYFSEVQLLRPTEFWASLSIPKGVKPVHLPTQGHPLEFQKWWIW